MKRRHAATYGAVTFALAACASSSNADTPGDALIVSARLPKNRGCCQLYQVDAKGREQRLPLRGRDPSWTPRTRRLAFIRRGELWVGSLDGSSHRVPIGRYVAARPSWAPDGDHLVFDCALGRRLEERRSGICTTTASRGGVRQLLWQRQRNTATTYYSKPSWSPRGPDIAYVRAVDDRKKPFVAVSVLRIDSRTERTQRLTLEAMKKSVDVPSWSPDGNELAYYALDFAHAPDTECTIRSVARDGTGDRVLVPSIRGVSGCSVTTLMWSPEGKRLAFSVHEDYCYVVRLRDSPSASLIRKPHLGCTGLAWVRR
jgi:Tol biopolymer transport system component